MKNTLHFDSFIPGKLYKLIWNSSYFEVCMFIHSEFVGWSYERCYFAKVKNNEIFYHYKGDFRENIIKVECLSD